MHAVIPHGSDPRALAIGQKRHVFGAVTFMDFRAFFRGVANQDFIELRARYLVGHRQGFIPGVGKVEYLFVGMMWRYEFCAPFFHADAANLIAHAEAIKQRHIGGQERFTNMEPRMMRFFEHHHMITALGQQRRNGRACRPTANNQYITVLRVRCRSRCMQSGAPCRE